MLHCQVSLARNSGKRDTLYLKSILFEVKPRDPATFVVVTLVVVAASCFACYLPARRAAKTDPLKSLRYE
jgi:ABC-type lipoprotein release transport system permease subunit